MKITVLNFDAVAHTPDPQAGRRSLPLVLPPPDYPVAEHLAARAYSVSLDRPPRDAYDDFRIRLETVYRIPPPSVFTLAFPEAGPYTLHLLDHRDLSTAIQDAFVSRGMQFRDAMDFAHLAVGAVAQWARERP